MDIEKAKEHIIEARKIIRNQTYEWSNSFENEIGKALAALQECETCGGRRWIHKHCNEIIDCPDCQKPICETCKCAADCDFPERKEGKGCSGYVAR